ncbi:MAG: flagellar FliJ protein [Pseudohongiellaceae bacterium]|jgi:flagellar FliJ protein
MAAKKTSERLHVVLKLAQIKQQQAAERLAEASRAVENNKQQGQQLRVYQREYNNHFHSYEQAPVNSQQMRNYQRFYNNLEEAVYTQDQRSDVAEQQLEFHRSHWQKCYGREKNMASLIDRKCAEEGRKQEGKIQREMDDRVGSRLDMEKRR